MPESFQPRFVDLVRNLTSTQGTGNFVLGAAVSGFTGFAAAIVAGESFYYSAIGVDKPNEREVGRGTMQANGTISRAAISGPLTNFTAGQKSIALIAAAEWFSAIEAASGLAANGTSGAATRTALAAMTSQAAPAILLEAGREGLFVARNYADHSAATDADTAQGVHIRSTAAPAKVWVRQYSGPADIRWFGGKADGTLDDFIGPILGTYGATDNAVALNAALAFFSANEAFSGAEKYYRAAQAIYFPAADGVYDFQSAVQVRSSVRLLGPGIGHAGGISGAILRWRPGMHGLIFHSYNSDAAGPISPSNYGAVGSIVDGLHLVQHSNANPLLADNYHGIWGKAPIKVQNFGVTGWSGNGIHIVASAGGGGPGEGNANRFHVGHGIAYSNEHGIFIDGADANAGQIDFVDASSNRGYGIFDSSFLGNTIIACHADSNGTGVVPGNGGISSLCSFAGNKYAVAIGQAAGASTNAPSGTTAHNASWYYIGAGGPDPAWPAWVSGMTWREGGAYRSDGTGNARSMFLNCYAEGNQGTSYITYPAIVFGGLLNVGNQGDGLTIEGGLSGFQSSAPFNVNHPGGFVTTGAVAAGGYLTLTGNNGYAGALTNSAKISHSNTEGLVLYGAGSNWDISLWSGVSGQALSVGGGINNADVKIFQKLTIGGIVQATGAVTGANLSGTNSGDQTIALTGDVTGSGTGSFAATIGANKVTFAKFVAAAGASIVGATAAGNFAELTPASARSVLGLAAVATSGSGGDLTAASVPYAKIQNVSATSKLLGRATAGAGVIEELGLAGGLAISGNNLTLGALTPTSVVTTGALTSSSPTAGNGYAAGAGGAVTQATSKSTAVTLNNVCGAITMNGAALATVTNVTFTLTNSAIAATDVVVVAIKSGAATAGTYQAWVTATAAGSCTITVRNISAGSLSEALVLNFAVNKAVIA